MFTGRPSPIRQRLVRARRSRAQVLSLALAACGCVTGALGALGAPDASAADPLAGQERELRTALAASATVIERTGETLTLRYPVRLGFAPDQPVMRPALTAVLDELARSLRRHVRTALVVAVYTDAIGRSEFNQQASQQRANVMAQYLQSHGVPAVRLISRGGGESAQLPAENTPEGRDLNRRVELVISALSS